MSSKKIKKRKLNKKKENKSGLTYLSNKSLGWLITKSARIVIRMYNEILEKHGISPSQSGILYLLHEKKNAVINQKEVGKYLFLNKVNVHKLIGRMEKNGWLKIKPHSYDKRCKIITITSEGRKLIPLIKKTDKKVSQKLSKIFDNFDDSIIKKGKDKSLVQLLHSILLQDLK